MSGGTVLKVEG